jgi:hypothetical protein
MTENIKISFKLLLSLYAIIPISLLILLIDIFYLNFKIRSILPESPFELIIFALIFNIPHIMTSFISYFDKEYIIFYKKNLVFGFIGICIFSYSLVTIHYEFAAISLIFYTMYHVLMQQMGIATIMMRGTNTYYKYWRFVGIIIASILYLFTFFKNKISYDLQLLFNEYLLPLLIFLFFILFLFTIKISKTSVGSFYHYSNFSLIISSCIFYYFSYGFFVVLLPRFVHDLTAFIFYGIHDSNRAKEKPNSNYLLRLFNKIKIPAFIISPLIGIVVAHYVHPIYYHSLILIMIISIMHYYIEGFMWKNDSIHRKYISFTD